MIRILIGAVLLLMSASLFLPPSGGTARELSNTQRIGGATVYALLGLALVFFGRRARRRRKALPRDPNDALIAAGLDGDLDGARAALDAGADVNHPPTAYGPLVSAIRGKNNAIVTLLVERGADLDARTGDGSTLLMIAAECGKAEAVRTLLAAGVNVDARNAFDHTALHLVGSVMMPGKKPEVAVELIEAGADLSGQVYPHKASLVASGPDRDSPFSWQLAHGMRDTRGNTLLMLAATLGRRRAVERLLPLIDRTAVNKDGKTALELARQAGHDEIVALLDESAAAQPGP
jgi:ankyrin repeat protein